MVVRVNGLNFWGVMNMRLLRCLAIPFALICAGSGNATLIHNYELNGSLSDSFGGPSLVQTNSTTGVIGTQAYTFAQNEGLTLSASAFSSLSTFSVETKFLFTDTTGYRRILDFKGGTSDTGFYDLNTALNFYNVVTGAPGVITPGVSAQVVFTRDGASKTVAGYVNGISQFSFVDNGDLGVITSLLTFFRDDTAVGGEASAGRVDYIRIYDNALSATEVAALPNGTLPTTPGAVPEPASWAMMLAGFGVVGGALRRRRVRFAYNA